MSDVFANQESVAVRWRRQIDEVRREKDKLMKSGASGSKIGAFTRRINDMEAKYAKLLQRGAAT